MSETERGLPALSVRRPLLAGVLNILIVLAGIAALFGLEVRELPDVDRPIVTVRATLPGAAPETMDAEVTSVLESAVARVAGVTDIFANSEENSTRIRIEFSPGSDLDTAAADVREAVNQVTRSLPDRVEDVFVTKADNDAEAILTVALVGEGLREDELSRILDRDVEPELLAVDGVASLQPFGKRQTQMRVVIDPLRLNRFGLTVVDLANVLQQAPFDVPVGSFGSRDQELIVRAEATAATPELIGNIVIRDNIRVSDVADVRLGPEDPTNLLRLNGEPVIGVGVVRRAQSNTIQIADAVLEKVDSLNARLDNAELRVLSDESVFIRTSVEEVFTSLLITISIVVIAIWVFLGSWKATLIPAIAIPVALIGTVAGIWLLGFSINLITLLALVLATGLIVDDSIVVLENVQRQQGEGLEKVKAAKVGTQQVFFAVIATTVVLVAVFIPISFLPSTIGRLFREFGFVLALSVCLSSFVALTLGPAIASKFDYRSKSDRQGPLKAFGNWLKDRYASILKLCLAVPLVTVGLSLGIAGGAYFLYGTLDQELVPSEDRGRVQVFARGPDGVGLTFMERQADDIEDIFQPYLEDGTIESLLTIVGRYDPNLISAEATLAPWDERTLSQQDLINQLRAPLEDIPGVRAFVFGPSSLPGRRGGGNRGGSLDVAITGPEYQEIFIASRAVVDAIEDEARVLANPTLSYQPTQPQLSLQIDRARAADLGVPLSEISQTLRTMVDGQDIVDLNVFDETIPIILEGRTLSIQSPEDLRNLFVRSEEGALIPLSTVTNIVEEGVAAELERVEQRRAIELEADIVDGVALADAIAAFEEIAAETLPDGIGYILQGDAETLNEANRDLLITYAFALVIVFLAMVAQFESLRSPFVVLLTIPFALAAAIYALYLTGVSLNIYSQIGLVLLIGLMAKNGILLVEFADQLRREGLGPKEATYEAALIRLRPITMTLISTVLGSLPLIVSDGAGAEARRAIGWVIFGGLGLSGIFTLFLAPALYLLVGGRGEVSDAEGKLSSSHPPIMTHSAAE